VRWNPDDDREHRQMAASLTLHHPGWWVMWSYYHRQWVAYYLGPEATTPIRHEEADQLTKQMRHATLAFAASLEKTPPGVAARRPVRR